MHLGLPPPVPYPGEHWVALADENITSGRGFQVGGQGLAGTGVVRGTLPPQTWYPHREAEESARGVPLYDPNPKLHISSVGQPTDTRFGP